jgi:hypothetical protein
MNRIAFTASVLAIGLMFYSATSNSQSRGEESDAASVSDFGDGIVLLGIDRTSGIEGRRNSVTLTDAKLVKLGERYFVRGRVWVSKQFPDSVWQGGVDAAVAWEDVAQFYIFSDEQMEKYIADRKEEME